jgi:hypothetical protein
MLRDCALERVKQETFRRLTRRLQPNNCPCRTVSEKEKPSNMTTRVRPFAIFYGRLDYQWKRANGHHQLDHT